MIEYRMMDETCLLCYCLHGGPIPIEETRAPETRPVAVESENGLPAGTIAGFLRAVCREYGSCAVLAIDGGAVIGKVRFYPQELWNVVTKDMPCVQTPDSVRDTAAFDLGSLPPKDSLSEKALYIWCFQLVNDYKAVAEGRQVEQPSYLGRGVGTNMLKMLIDWARAEGWDQIRAKAVSHIPPLMMWSARLSVDRYRKLGFQTTLSTTDREEGALHKRRGYHGEAMRKMWEPYAHLADEEVTRVYDVVLDLENRD